MRQLVAILLVCMVLVCLAYGVAYGGESLISIVTFTCDGNLEFQDGSGKVKKVQVIRGKEGNLRYVQGKKGKGLYLPSETAISLPIENFNPQEGTVSFWFRPDWSPNTRTPFIMFYISSDDGPNIRFRRGWTAPDRCYLQVECTPPSVTSFSSHNLFTARTWRHYALRWSAEREIIQFLVDGDCGGRRQGKFSCEVDGPVTATLVLHGESRGAFDEVKVYDLFLEIDELIKKSELTKVAHHLQEQAPPPGAELTLTDDAFHDVSYVDPATGKQVTVWAIKDGKIGGEKSTQFSVYNPANLPELPESEHTKWARPLAGGPLRVLFVMKTGFYHPQSQIREVVELWQRLDMECEVTDKPDPAVLKKDYDVIVVSHQGYKRGGPFSGWQDIDETLRQWILKHVKSGKSGLVYVFPIRMDGEIRDIFSPGRKVSPKVVLRGFPTVAMHRLKGETFPKVKAYELTDEWFETPENMEKCVQVFDDGTVRAVKLNYTDSVTGFWPGIPTLTPDTSTNSAATDMHYDRWMALTARAILFAAGRLPSTRIVSTTLNSDSWSVSVNGLAETAKLQVRAQDAWGRIYFEDEISLNRNGQVSLSGVHLPPHTFVDFILRNVKGEVLDWYCAATPPPIDTRIAGIHLDKNLYEKGAMVRGNIEVTARIPGEYNLNLYLTDHEGRRLVSDRIPLVLEEGKRQVSFGLVIPLSSNSLLMRLEAILIGKDGTIADIHNANCPIPKKDFDGFYVGMYGSEFNRRRGRISRKWFSDEFGLDYMLGRAGIESANCAMENLLSIEYLTSLGRPKNEKSLAKWMEPWEEFFPKGLRSGVNPEMIPSFRPIFYSLGEEHYMLVGRSSHPEVTARFRQYLQGKYTDLAKLNEVWGTAFKSWDQVKMLTPDIANMLKIKYDVPMFENRRFMDQLFADKHTYLARYFRQIDPYAQVGIHAGWDLWMKRGYDYWALSRGMEVMIGYMGVQNQYIRSFFQKHYGCFFHYDLGCHYDVRWHPWRMLMSGARGFAFYTISPETWGAVTADLHLSSDFQAAKEEFKDVGDIGDMLVRTRYQDDQVAIHYSQDSFQAGVSNISWIHTSFVNLLFDAGVSFKFVSYEQVANGELLKNKYPVFVMPHSISLSEDEVKAIRKYVKEGGVVWADIVPGEYNNFGQKLDKSQLSALFTNMKRLIPGKNYWIGKGGKGKVILADIGNYNYDRNVGDYLKTQELLDEIVEIASVKRVAHVINVVDNKLANGVWTAGYRSGNQRYVVITKDYQLADRNDVGVWVKFGNRGHIYEMRSGEYFGYTDKVQTQLQPTRGKVYSILPYRVGEIVIPQKGQATRGQDLVLKVRLATEGEVGKDDLHLIRVSVTSPNGKEVTALRRLVLIRGGTGEIQLPVAYDDAPGRWTVQLKDAATGIQKDVYFTLVPF